MAAVGATLLVLVVATAPRWRPDDSGGSGSADRERTATGHEAPVLVEARPARRTGSVRPEPPRSVRLPSGVIVPVRAVSTRPDGFLGVPGDLTSAGWWRGGSAVGDPLGSTLIAAHVDSTTQGLGPFAVLLGARPGQRVVLASATLRQSFRITSLRLLPKGSLVRHPWVSSASGPRRLVLATCAPPYLRDQGGYQNLAVVTAVPGVGAEQAEQLMSVDPGWVLHESGHDEAGYEGWLYHYADGVAVAEDGSPVALADPGWILHQPSSEGTGYAGWLYHYADGAVVAEDGSPYEETDPPPAPATEEQSPEPDVEPDVEPNAEPDAEPSAEPESAVVPESARSLPPTSPPRRQPRTSVRCRVLATLAGWRLDVRLVSLRAADAIRRLPTRAVPHLRILGLLAVVLVLIGGVGLARLWGGAERTGLAGSVPLDPPAALHANGEYVLSRVRVTGDVAVEHWIRSARPVSSVTLAVPSTVPHSGSGVVARNVLLESDGQVRRGADMVGDARRTFSLDGANLVRVSYVLSGVVVRSSSARDRALAGVTALDLSYHRDRVPRTLVVQGGRLLSAACSTPAPDAQPRPCGVPDGLGWRVHLRPSTRDDRVMVQLDMP